MNNTFNDIIKSIFERALELDKLSRATFFNNLNVEEKKYVDEVKSLLEAYEAESDFLEIESDRNIFSEHNVGPHPLIGKRIGPYLIEEEIGVGGMGIVFEGKRADKEFEQSVAIKILKQGLSSEYLVKRFQNERQTLANLQHPNIAKLFDGGKTEEGLPYLVMEYIDGVPITEYCIEEKLSISEILKLFTTVCNAIQYAHQNLVVHRDIKPGNILVNREGRPKLLDFGVAKLLDQDTENSTEDLTKTGTWHLTPEYASPEQIKGIGITTSSDTYSLGILLYQLLTGETPYKIYNSSLLAINKILNESKISLPSENVKNITGESENADETKPVNNIFLHKQLKGDLDNIVMKAMHKDPNQRYSSVKEFSNDIERYLNGLPVIARKDTFAYRTTRFVQRHKVGFILFIIGNILGLASIIAIIHQGNIAAKERDNARIELNKFEEVNQFLQDMLASADPESEGKEVKVYDILDKANSDAEVKLKKYPKIKSAIKQTLGSTFIGLGEYEKAESLITESLELNKKFYGENSKETAKSLHQLGLCYDWIGNFKLADSFYNAGINTYENVSDEPLKGLADNLNDYGTYLTNIGEYDSSTAIFNHALDIYSKYNSEKGQKEAITINNLAVNYHHQYKVDLAEKYYLEAQELLTNLYGINRPEVASIFNNLAFIYLDNKEYESSQKAFEKSYEIKLDVLGPDHPSAALTLINMGMLKFIQKEYSLAEIPLKKAINNFLRTNSKKDPFLALAYYWLGRSYTDSDNLIDGDNALRKSLSIREEIFPENNSKIWSTRGELGICLLKQGKYVNAEKLLISSLEFYKNAKHEDKIKIKRYTEFSAKLYKETGNLQKEKFYQAELSKLTDSTAILN